MSLLTGVLAAGRAQAEARFTETFKVYTITRSADPDPVTGLYVETETTIYAAVPGRLKYPTMTVSEHTQAGQVPAVQDVHVHTAVGSVPLAVVNTLWRCTASAADVGLEGRVWRTKGAPQAGQVTATRTPVEEAN